MTYLWHINEHNVSRFRRCHELCLRCRAKEVAELGTNVDPEFLDEGEREGILAQLGGELLSNERMDAFGNWTPDEDNPTPADVDPNITHVTSPE